jgi:hypothetical protein
MSKLSAIQVAQLALNAGLDQRGATIAVAVAAAESGFNPQAHNAIPPDDSYGLWQINMLGAMGPERRQRYGLKSNADLYDPATNARVMADMSARGTKWTPWTTYTSGRYLLHATIAGMAVQQAMEGRGSTPDAPAGGSFENLLRTIRFITNPQSWQRIGLFAVGFVLLVVALFKLTGNNQLGPTAKKVVKAGKLVVMKKVSK